MDDRLVKGTAITIFRIPLSLLIELILAIYYFLRSLQLITSLVNKLHTI